MEPWLDSLSEDWKSQHTPSSPSVHSNGSRSKIGSVASSRSQSRIPHLLHKQAVSGSYLQPRSSRGLARSKTSPVLSERRASDLNITAQPRDYADAGSQRKLGISTIPRRASSTFSDSAQSVQYSSVQIRPTQGNKDDTPEWKRRLARGEDVAADGLDLFGPSHLEGIFKQPAPPRPAPKPTNLPGQSIGDLWVPPGTSEPSQSFRLSKGRIPGMEVLQEVNEDEEELEKEPESDIHTLPESPARGYVMSRVQSLENAHIRSANHQSSQRDTSGGLPGPNTAQDPRLRTVSGQEEIGNEDISPITMSKQNTIRDQAIRISMDESLKKLQSQLKDISIESDRRPSSSSSDQDVHYGHDRKYNDGNHQDDLIGDLTSLSLPDDVSMGTQDFVSNGGYVNRRRGGTSNENSFRQKLLSPSSDSMSNSRVIQPRSIFASSPPAYVEPWSDIPDPSHLTMSAPATPHPAATAKQIQTTNRVQASGSPLKLFGARDTYTNNKLLRALSHFEEPDDRLDDVHQQSRTDRKQNLPMSEFGKGEFDGFDFSQSVNRRAHTETQKPEPSDSKERIFQADHESFEGDESVFAQFNMSARPGAQAPAFEESLGQDYDTKRLPKSPLKDRTPKRRRTLLQYETDLLQRHQSEAAELGTDSKQVAGKKRKDAKSDSDGGMADPIVLASREMLQPRGSTARQLSGVHKVQKRDEVQLNASVFNDGMANALAGELAAFTQGVAQAQNDTRKPSVTTKDYMEEANKVMQLIRARGKPISKVANVAEYYDESELNPDAILDLDVDADSTKDSFSRPPSREGVREPVVDRRHAVHHPRVASHLRKFQDQDDLELLENTSMLGTAALADNDALEDAALVPVPEDQQQSSPPNLRLLNYEDHQRKRKHSTSTAESCHLSQRDEPESTHALSSNSSKQTFPTGSSGSSGHKGVINSGTVVIPDKIGAMTFDHEKKTWIKARFTAGSDFSKDLHDRQTISEEDPFEHIPDLSISDKKEPDPKIDLRTQEQQRPPTETLRGTIKVGHKPPSKEVSPDIKPKPSDIHPKDTTQNKNPLLTNPPTQRPLSPHSEIAEHELLVHDGQASRLPRSAENSLKQPRSVTIAFSSPLISAVRYQQEPDTPDIEESEMPEDLPQDEYDIPDENSITKSRLAGQQVIQKQRSIQPEELASSVRHHNNLLQGYRGRPVSRVDEADEDVEHGPAEMSLVHTNYPAGVTPVSHEKQRALAMPNSAAKGTSIICLTPLSEFSLHQVDNPQHVDHSYVAERAHPTSLRQAHGSHALAVDALVKAITDAEPTELFWEQLRRLDLGARSLTALHGLHEYCSSLEVLALPGNRIEQLVGLPASVRTLNISNNCLSNLTSWGHLHNLQYLDVSRNNLETLEGFSSLVHLRKLKASGNHVQNIEGILDLDGLLSLDLSNNDLTNVDFEGTELMRLAHLDLGGNHLVSLKNLYQLHSLETLNVSHNELKQLVVPDQAAMTNLYCLHASNNELEVLNLSGMPFLEKLDLDCNKIHELVGLEDARHLQKLSLRQQQGAADIVNYVFGVATECQEILLSRNIVPQGKICLPRLPHYNLRQLEISCCGLTVLPDGFDACIPNCQVLNLDFNAIKEIGPLRALLKLKSLSLKGNRIQRLRRTCLILARLRALAKLDLRDNPLTMGFYSPEPICGQQQDVKQIQNLADQSRVRDFMAKQDDETWIKLVDEITRLKRRTTELILAEKCEALKELDGLVFDRLEVLGMEQSWQKLMLAGVLQKKVLMPPPAPQEQELPVEVGVGDELTLPLDAEMTTAKE